MFLLEDGNNVMNTEHEKLIRQFANAVIEQNEAIERHDIKSGNKFANKYIKASETLIGAGGEGIRAFACLLDDRRIAVRVMAASYLLPYCTNEAIPILRKAAGGKGITALGAYMTLKRWEASN